MLFYPLEEGLDKPSVLIEHGHFHGLELEIVGQKDQCPAGFTVMVLYAPQLFGIVLGCMEPCKPDGLVASQTFGLVHLCGIYPFGPEVLLGRDQKICARPVYPIKPCVVQGSPVHHIKGPGQKDDHIKYVDIVHLSIGDMYEIRDGGLCVHFRVHLYRGLGLAELCPRIKAQTKIDGRGVDDEYVILYIDL